MQRPIRGAQRRIEARIGQLLGPAKHGGDRQVVHDQLALIRGKHTRHDFRLLARALDGDCYLTLED
jgi:hypothetical protein